MVKPKKRSDLAFQIKHKYPTLQYVKVGYF